MFSISSSVTENAALLLVSSVLLTVAYGMAKREKYLAIGCALSSVACILGVLYTLQFFVPIPAGPVETALHLVAFVNRIVGLGALLIVLHTAKENIALPQKGFSLNAPWLWRNINSVLALATLGAVIAYFFGALGLGGGIEYPDPEATSSVMHSGIADISVTSLMFMTAFVLFFVQVTQLVRIWMKGEHRCIEEP